MQWNFNYRHPVTKNRINMALGPYPEVSLAQARNKTIEARELLAQGIDPKAQRNELQEAKRAQTEHTFENVATAWFELKKDSVTPAYAEDIWRSLTLHVFPSMKPTPLPVYSALLIVWNMHQRSSQQFDERNADKKQVNVDAIPHATTAASNAMP